MEKLARQPQALAAARTIRRRQTRLIDEDAQAFARVIQAMSRRPWLFRRQLRRAVEIPAQVHDDARRLGRLIRGVQRVIPPRYQVDLRCAAALAEAAAASAKALIATNLAWLNEPTYARRLRRRLARFS